MPTGHACNASGGYQRAFMPVSRASAKMLSRAIIGGSAAPARYRAGTGLDRAGPAGSGKSLFLNGLLTGRGAAARPGAGECGSPCGSGLTRLLPITTIIGSNPARRIPAPRRPGDGANHCNSGVFGSPAPALARDGRHARQAGRAGAGKGGCRGAPRRSAPRRALRARRCRRGRNQCPEPAAGVRRRRTAEPGPARSAGDRLASRCPAAWASYAHLPTIPCFRRRPSEGDTLQASGGNAVPCVQLHFPMPSFADCLSAGRPGSYVLHSPLFLVSEPGSAWIMPGTGTFMRPRHAARPASMAPPGIARPRLWGEPGRSSAAFPGIARRRVPSVSSLRTDRQAPPRSHRLRSVLQDSAPDRNRQVVSACRNSPMPPCAVRPCPGIEKFRIRLDDPVRAHRSGACAPEESAICRVAGWTGTSIELLRPDARPQMATGPALRPGHKVGGGSGVRSRSSFDAETRKSPGVGDGPALVFCAPPRCRREPRHLIVTLPGKI